MNKTLAAAIALTALPLVGCAGPEITAEDASMANAAALSRNYCVDARARGKAARGNANKGKDFSTDGLGMARRGGAGPGVARQGKDFSTDMPRQARRGRA